ncbi:type IV pilus assembly protein PilV [Desulfuromusa kysingii]|uniref:Type IV pilus assembly protein PilV n=1 Tax=Desulfuromusa kysingii TaxID=37625 RepID=A0A1H4E9A6_9BACT|nr:type IV pilus modification protein PilV [Desulfuromusa kysingii]SEA81623.1 type IV pilus assembly protein PilV [Desulfuromusa kysingii]
MVKKIQRRLGADGFSLVEALVALLVLSIGLLGVAGLQTNSLRSGNNALLHSKAVQSCEDIMDRMRANRAAAVDGDYDVALTIVPAAPTYTGMVETDLDEWKTALQTNLPQGDGSIATVDNIVTVTVQWQDSFGADSVVVGTRL